MTDKIQLNDSFQDVIIKLSEGNPGALNACVSILKTGEKIDPDNIMGGIGTLLLLDTFKIYGTDIYVLWSDICNKDTAKMIAVIRATQMGMFNLKTLQDACSRQDYSGRDMVPADELYIKVKERLPKFDLNTEIT